MNCRKAAYRPVAKLLVQEFRAVGGEKAVLERSRRGRLPGWKHPPGWGNQKDCLPGRLLQEAG